MDTMSISVAMSQIENVLSMNNCSFNQSLNLNRMKLIYAIIIQIVQFEHMYPKKVNLWNNVNYVGYVIFEMTLENVRLAVGILHINIS